MEAERRRREKVMKGEAMDILTIPAGRAMDALVAEKVMGLHRSMEQGLGEDVYEEWRNAEGCRVRPYGTLPNYSTDIAAAWEVVEKLAKPLKVVWTGKVWVCAVFEEEYSHEADTAPLAICRAALSRVMESQKIY